MIADFRSDTVTRPSQAMKDAMMSAPLGDDVMGDDPTVKALEAKLALMFGHEAGLFCPSGTMTNQLAIRTYTKPGDELICDADAHIYMYEGGGIASNSGVSVKLIHGDRGRIHVDQLKDTINPDDPHFANTKLICLENTSNRGGGSCYELDDISTISKWALDNDVKRHLDGARVFNAITAKSYTPADLGTHFDSISICLSKGLGAPVGSVLIGSKDFIHQAKRARKSFGGGMRQAGIIAAAGIYALDHHVEGLQRDHDNAKRIGKALNDKSWIASVDVIETNLVAAMLHETVDQQKLIAKLDEKGVRISGFGPGRIRFATHLDVSDEMMEHTLSVLNDFA